VVPAALMMKSLHFMWLHFRWCSDACSKQTFHGSSPLQSCQGT
jgi:hypothetical protein